MRTKTIKLGYGAAEYRALAKLREQKCGRCVNASCLVTGMVLMSCRKKTPTPGPGFGTYPWVSDCRAQKAGLATEALL